MLCPGRQHPGSPEEIVSLAPQPQRCQFSGREYYFLPMKKTAHLYIVPTSTPANQQDRCTLRKQSLRVHTSATQPSCPNSAVGFFSIEVLSMMIRPDT